MYSKIKIARKKYSKKKAAGYNRKKALQLDGAFTPRWKIHASVLKTPTVNAVEA